MQGSIHRLAGFPRDPSGPYRRLMGHWACACGSVEAGMPSLSILQTEQRIRGGLGMGFDDMGYGDPGAFGGGALIGAATPNMDRLAREGLKLTSTYSQPTCTPTRSAILTGRLPVRTGLTRPILAGDKITKNPWADEVS